jgi:hypothetical protein
MKQLLFLFFIALSSAVSAQSKADTVVLKNGKAIAGYIYKMEGNKIHIAKAADTAVYSADEVQTLMFCHPVRSNGPCSGSGSSASSGGSSFSSVGTSSANSNSDNKENGSNEEKGTALFQCNMCGGKVDFRVKGENGNNKTESRVNTELASGEVFSYKEKFIPGTYYWSYKDTNKNQANGYFTIAAGEEKKIILFEKK